MTKAHRIGIKGSPKPQLTNFPTHQSVPVFQKNFSIFYSLHHIFQDANISTLWVLALASKGYRQKLAFKFHSQVTLKWFVD